MGKLAASAAVAGWSPWQGPRWGWVAVALYLVTAWQCARLARGRGGGLAGGEAACWRLLGVALVALGLYKLFDLQTALAQWGRLVASEHRWYLRRRPVQLALIAGASAASALGTGLALALARRAPAPTRAAAVAGVALVGFVAIRTISLHAIDRILDAGIAGVRVNWIIELGGIAAIWISIRRRIAYRPQN